MRYTGARQRTIMSIDLRDFEQRVRLRELHVEDYDELVDLQQACFPGMQPWLREQLESQVRRFPEGQLCIELDGRIVASSSGLIVDYSDYSEWHDYMRISDKGYIRNHDSEGDTFYGIEIMVHPEFRGQKLARRLYDARKQICRDRNLARMIIGGRIPGYADHKSETTAQEYVERVIDRSLYDPVLTAQLANRFQVRQLVEDYLPSDEDSAGWATILEWPNLDYRPGRSLRARRAVEPVRLAVVQYQMRSISSFEEFERQCEFFVDVASDHKADFVVFPELFTLQLLSLVSEHRPGEAARALASFTPRYLELFGGLSVRYNVNIIGGSQFTIDEEDRLFNVAYLFRRDGTLAQQPKLHVTPNESYWWGVRGGDDFGVFDTDRGKVAILVCYDIEFPELVRVAAKKGARMVFVPSNTTDRLGHLRVRCCAQARCIENHIYVVNAGCVGNLPFVENADIHYSQSAVYTPSDIPFARDGIAVEAEPNVETVLVHDLDLELLRRARRTGTVQNWRDRRTDLYTIVWKREGDELDV